MTKQFALKNDDHYGVRFIHLRSTYSNGMSKKRDSNNYVDTSYGGMTFAYDPLLIVRKDGSVGVCVEIGAALCSGHDRYVKKIGREKSLNFLANRTNGHFVTLYLGEGEFEPSMQEGKVPLIFNAAGDMYIDERMYNLRGYIIDTLVVSGF